MLHQVWSLQPVKNRFHVALRLICICVTIIGLWDHGYYLLIVSTCDKIFIGLNWLENIFFAWEKNNF